MRRWPSIDQLRRSAGAAVADGFFRGASRLGRLHPRARPEAHGVRVLRDVPYDAGDPRLRLDVWSPSTHADRPRPAVLYVHGGGFRILSKDSHWIMALLFARKGYVVFNVDYRLAPEHPFPAAVEDTAKAYAWVTENAHLHGASAEHLVLAGESAGANLVTALTVAACYERPEPHAQTVFRTGVTPKAVLPACGMHQVTDPQRFGRTQRLPRFIQDRLEEVTHAYLGHLDDHQHPALDLADPLRFLETAPPPARPLPPFFLTCGTADPLLPDTERLHEALRRKGAPAEARYYLDEHHAFHAFLFRKSARRHWRDTFAFLERHLPAPR